MKTYNIRNISVIDERIRYLNKIEKTGLTKVHHKIENLSRYTQVTNIRAIVFSFCLVVKR